MMESPIYQEILEEGEIKGKAEGKAEFILHVLERRFGSVSDGIRGRISDITEIETLDTLLDHTLDVASLDAFIDKLP